MLLYSYLCTSLKNKNDFNLWYSP